MKRISIKVPATTANMGPGFDAIGAALDIYNEFEVVIGGDEKIRISAEGEGADKIPTDGNNMVYKAMLKGLQYCKIAPPNIEIRQKINIPLKRGLGSSATAVIAGLLTAREISAGKLSGEDIVNIGAEMEGHCDNLLAALQGGIVLNYKNNSYGGVKFMPPEPIVAALAIPEILVETDKAREILPESYAFGDVVQNIRNSMLLVSSLQSGKYGLLRIAMVDFVHEPFRADLIPGFFNVREAAYREGALGVSISGSGSTILALCKPDQGERVAKAMEKAFCEHGISCRSKTAKISSCGAHILN